VTVRLLATARRPLNGRSIFLSRLFRGSIGAVALAPSGLIAGERGEQENAPLVVWQSRSAQSHISLLNSIRLNHSEPDRKPATTPSAPKVVGTTFNETASWPPKPSGRVIPEPVLGQLRREFSARRRA
jgi:hypothetical protein